MAAVLTACTRPAPTTSPAVPESPLPLVFDVQELLHALLESCADDADRQGCLERGVVSTVNTIGPEAAIPLLQALIASDDTLDKKDYHDLTHRIGRATAKIFGVTPQAFVRCPLDFNYGCPHGFFEQALIEQPDARKAALKICDPDFLSDQPRKSHFYCFHGVGHGVMMAKAYRLEESLALCDSFPEGAPVQGCWQGVFMENVNGVMTGALPDHRFSDEDLLRPCNALDERYRWECYINHAGYLVPKSGHSLERATAECLREETDAKHSCLQSIGLMATNPSWQRALVAEDYGSVVANAASICLRFPQGFMEDCISGAIDNLANFDRTDTTNAVDFCSRLPERTLTFCYGHIGPSFANELPPGVPKTVVCDSVPVEYREVCTKPLML